jgi:hypothetical protein
MFLLDRWRRKENCERWAPLATTVADKGAAPPAGETTIIVIAARRRPVSS